MRREIRCQFCVGRFLTLMLLQADRPLTQAVLTTGGRRRPRSVAGGSDKRRTKASAFRGRRF